MGENYGTFVIRRPHGDTLALLEVTRSHKNGCYEKLSQ
jgi:hypothetical protein